MRVLVTGADGFIGQNLAIRLGEDSDIEVVRTTRNSTPTQWEEAINTVDAIMHLAGVNRPQDTGDYKIGNSDLTGRITSTLLSLEKTTPIFFASSTQVISDNPYGKSKRIAEQSILDYSSDTGASCVIYRLPNVFGKWCKPNYNSAIATFCHNIGRDLPVTINDPTVKLTLVYVDDVVDEFLRALKGKNETGAFGTIPIQYEATVGELVDTITSFKANRDTLMIDRVGTGLMRALYSTYLSYLPEELFSYRLPVHADARGIFSEILKTANSGQFSFFTAHPGITRGGHYHHTKTEKFLVVKGSANFRFRHIVTGQFFELATTADVPTIVETIPGWSHDITNTSNDEMIVMLWANEVFDRQRPDTIARFVA